MKGIFLFIIVSFNIFCSYVYLKTDLQDVPPKFFINKKNEVRGVSYEIIKLIEKNSNYRFVFEKKLVPISRVTYDLGRGITDVQFGLQKTKERETQFNYGQELYGIKIVGLVSKITSLSINKINDLKNNGNITILTQYGTAVDASLKQIKGLKIDDGSKSLENSIEKLLLNRGQIVIYHDLSINYIISNFPQYKDKFKVISIDFGDNKELADVGQFIAFSKKVPRNIIKDLNEIIIKLKENGEIEGILKKYR